MKKILCMLLIVINAVILSSCARLNTEDEDSSVQSTSSVSLTSSLSESRKSDSDSKDSDKESNETTGNEEKTESAGDKSTSKINININNNTDGGGSKTVQYASSSTKQYYLQKLDDIEAGMSDLEGLRSGSNADMKQAAGIEYRRWDDVLNEIYSVLKGQLSNSAMSSLQKEEFDWINYKESEAQRCADAFKVGSAESLVYTSTLSELTKERCYYLVNNYME